MENFSEHLNLCQKYTAVEKTFLKEPYSWFGMGDVQLYVIESKTIIQDFSKLEREMNGLMKIVFMVPWRY